MSEDEIKKEKPDIVLNLFEKILEFTNQNQNKKGQGLKILTYQMLGRLPIFLAQLKTGNNSGKLNNETIQLLYSLYHSKKSTKTIYKYLVSIV